MHPYHNNPILNDIRTLQNEITTKRREFEAETIAPLKKKIEELKAKRHRELIEYDKKRY